MNPSPGQQGPAKYFWRTLPRAATPKRSVTERIADFLEVYGGMDEQTAQIQASRCLQCPDAPCIEGCPMGNEIPQWMAFVQEGRFHEAAQFITASGCMPDIVSRLCRQTCEDFCVLEGAGAPVAISAIERLLTRYALEHELTEPVSPTPNGLRVAVVGSGPSALACCFDLVKAGYALTVFDSHNLPGGMLVQGIPSFQLDKSLVQRRIHQLQQLGVEFRMNIKWGVDASLSNLCTNYDAVFIGPCAEGAKPLDIPGADSAGVHQALDFIIQKNFPQALTQVPLDVRGKRVIVLGGGDTAIDGLRTAIRCGAAEATCLYHRQQSDMPCHPRDYLDAAEEGAKFQFSTRATAVLKDSQAKLTVRCVKTLPGPLDQTGRPEPVAQPGSECNLTADVVLVAYGFVAPSIFSDAELHQLKVNEWGGIAVDEWQMTNIPNVFAAGVVVRRSMLLPETVRDARKAAKAIDRSLAHRSLGGPKSAILPG